MEVQQVGAGWLILDQVYSVGASERIIVQMEDGLCTVREDPNTYKKMVLR